VATPFLLFISLTLFCCLERNPSHVDSVYSPISRGPSGFGDAESSSRFIFLRSLLAGGCPLVVTSLCVEFFPDRRRCLFQRIFAACMSASQPLPSFLQAPYEIERLVFHEAQLGEIPLLSKPFPFCFDICAPPFFFFVFPHRSATFSIPMMIMIFVNFCPIKVANFSIYLVLPFVPIFFQLLFFFPPGKCQDRFLSSF